MVYTGGKEDRQLCRDNDWYYDHEESLKFQVLITSYETFRIDCNFFSKIDWEVVIMDEGHRVKNINALLR